MDTLCQLLEEDVARLHLEKIDMELERLYKVQADYIGVTVEEPIELEHY